MSKLPLTVTLVAWAAPMATLVLGALGQSSVDLSVVTLAICGLGLLSVAGGSVAAAATPLGNSRPIEVQSRSALRVLFVVCALASVGAYIAISEWMSLGFQPLADGFGALYGMNVYLAQEGDVVGGLVGRLYALIPIAAIYGVYLYLNGASRSWMLVVVVAAGLLLAMNPRRHQLIQTASACGFLYVLHARPRVTTLISLASASAAIFLVYFGYTQVQLKKIESFDFASIVHVTSHYYASSVLVMDNLLQTNHFDDVWVLLNVPARIWNFVFTENLNVDLSIPFISVPEPANTVPAFYYLYRSGGYFGVIAISSILGFVSTYLWRAYQETRSFSAGAIASLATTSLLFSVRECTFITYEFYTQVVAVLIIGFLIKYRVVLR